MMNFQGRQVPNRLLEINGEITPNRIKRSSQSKSNNPAVDLTGDASKVQQCKEQYCIGTWNVSSMNQSKLEVVKKQMARVNIEMLGISELKWTGMGEFNSDDHYINYCGQESLEEMEQPLQLTKESEMQYLDAISKMTEWSVLVSTENHFISQ